MSTSAQNQYDDRLNQGQPAKKVSPCESGLRFRPSHGPCYTTQHVRLHNKENPGQTKRVTSRASIYQELIIKIRTETSRDESRKMYSESVYREVTDRGVRRRFQGGHTRLVTERGGTTWCGSRGERGRKRVHGAASLVLNDWFDGRDRISFPLLDGSAAVFLKTSCKTHPAPYRSLGHE